MPSGLASDPENRLFGRMNRRRLDAEAIRDSLLAVAGRLDRMRGGPAFAELAVPRRTLVLDVGPRPGANTSDFGRLFDRADPGSIVARRGQSVVAPQALFFLNDPFVNETGPGAGRAGRSRGARRTTRPASDGSTSLALGRPPSRAEIDLGRATAGAGPGCPIAWERYCQLISVHE